jgi:DNA-binding transcriptional LysR family regulator
LTRLSREHPRLRVTMTQREPEDALHDTWTRDFDLVIAEQYPGHAAPWHPELDRVSLTSDAIRLAVPPPGLPFRGIQSIAAARSAPWVMEPPGVASRHFAEQMCRRAGFEPDVRYETADLQAQVRLIESGNAVALLPDLLWTSRAPKLELFDLEGSPRRTIFTSTRDAASGHPGVLACRRALTEIVTELLG